MFLLFFTVFLYCEIFYSSFNLLFQDFQSFNSTAKKCWKDYDSLGQVYEIVNPRGASSDPSTDFEFQLRVSTDRFFPIAEEMKIIFMHA